MSSEVSEAPPAPAPPLPDSSRSIQFYLPRDNSQSDQENENEESFEWGVPMNRVTIIGRVRSWGSLTKLEIILFVTTILAVITSICFTTVTMLDGNSQDSVFSSLVILNSLFILFYLTHGILVEEFLELIAMSFSLVLICVLLMVNYIASSEQRLKSMDLIISIIFSVIVVPTVLIASTLSWKYWTEGNLIFRIVGADMKFQRMCRLLLLAQSLLAFDAQWTLVSLILVFQQGFQSATNEQILLLFFGLSLICLWLFIGYFAMRFESNYLTCLFVGTSLFQPLYILYLFIKSFITFRFSLDLLNVTMYIAGGVCLTSHFSLIAVIASVSSNYGKGLAQKVYGSGEVQSSQTSSSVQAENPDPNYSASETSPLLSSPIDADHGNPRQPRNYSSTTDQQDPDGIYPV